MRLGEAFPLHAIIDKEVALPKKKNRDIIEARPCWAEGRSAHRTEVRTSITKSTVQR